MNLTKKFITVGSIATIALFGAAFSVRTTAEAIELTSEHVSISRTSKAASSWTGVVDTTGELKSEGVSDTMFYSNFPGYESNGFNLSTYQAAVAYANAIGKTPADISYRQTANYDDTGAMYIDDIKNIYNDGGKVVISSGFQVAATFEGVYDFDGNLVAEGVWGAPDANGVVADHDEEYVVLLDDNVLGTKYKNAVSVQFAAEGAGYEAGLIASLYTIGNEAAGNVDNQNIVMWGGINYGTVYSFMSGFAQAVTDVNDFSDAANITLWSGGGYDKDDREITESNTYGTSDTVDNQTWYSGGFGTEDDTKLAEQKTKNALDAGASVVFPVAGGNTGTALDTIANSKNESNTAVIGVDTDNTIDYSGNADLILGSATKSLVEGGLLGLLATGAAIGEYDAAVVAANSNLEELLANIPNWKVDLVTDWWTEPAGNIPNGLVLQGTIDNGGVGFTYENANETTASGINAMLEESINAILADTALVDALGLTATDATGVIAEVLAKTPAAASINASDDFFSSLETTMPSAQEDGSSLLWLWITLVIIAVLAIVGVLVYFLVLKKD